ncbi:hypothetical protein IT087_02490 [Candidatus Uhrbacteria bacterium]|nr:hypothetical protein [Candidatus Uhrbacteria bacterium]
MKNPFEGLLGKVEPKAEPPAAPYRSGSSEAENKERREQKIREAAERLKVLIKNNAEAGRTSFLKEEDQDFALPFILFLRKEDKNDFETRVGGYSQYAERAGFTGAEVETILKKLTSKEKALLENTAAAESVLRYREEKSRQR